MPRWLQMSLFASVAVSVLAGWHFFLWLRLVRDPAWPAWLMRPLSGLLLALALSIPLAMIALRLLPRGLSLPLAFVAFVWMGLGFYLLVIVGAADLLKALLLLATKLAHLFVPAGPDLPTDPARRAWMARAVEGLGLAGATLAGLGGLRVALGKIDVKRVAVGIDGWPADRAPLRLVQLSDMHIGEILGRRFVEEVVAQVNALDADAVVITGDLVDGSVEGLGQAVAPLARLKSRHGTFFVTGNHEYYSGAEEWCAYLGSIGLRVLDNAHHTLRDAQGRALLHIAGVPDPTARQLGPQRRPDVSRSLAHRAADAPTVLLAHQPKIIDAAAEHGVDLVLSGHTHGGQIWPFGYVVALTQPYLAGLHPHKGSQIYVSRGTGFWGPPLRLGAPAEITEIVLAAKQPTRQ